MAQRLVGGVALDRVGEDVGGGLHEGDVLGAKRSGSVAWTSSTPKGWSLPSIITARLLAAPKARSTGGIVKRSSLAQSGTIAAAPESSAAPAWESRAAETRRPAPTTSLLEPGAEVEPAAVAADLPDAGAVDAVDFADQLHRGLHQRLGVAVLQRPLAQPRDHRLLGEGPLQVLLGVLRSVMS